MRSVENVPQSPAQPTLMAPPVQPSNTNDPKTGTVAIQPHALDPINKNILPLGSSLVPHQPEKNNTDAQDQPLDFDIPESLSDTVDDQ